MRQAGSQYAFVILLLGLQYVASVMGFYAPSSDVVQLTPNNFKSKVLNSDGIVLVEFFAPWCGHCKNLVPAWDKAATSLKGIATVAALDADAHKSLAQEYGIQGFPTIKVFIAGKAPVDYQGPREAKGIVEFALAQVRSLAQDRLKGGKTGSKSQSGSKAQSDKSASVELSSKNFDQLVLQSSDIWLVEFYAPWCGHCKKLAPEWKTAANNLKGRVKLGHVDCDADKSLMGKYGIKGFPTILLFGADKVNPLPFEGSRVASEIESFALRQLEDIAVPPEVVELTGQDVLESKCSPAAICFVTFLPDILDSKAEGRNRYIAVLKKVSETFKRNAYSWVWAAAGKQPGLEKAVDVGGYGYPALVAVNTKKGLYNPLRSAFELDAVVNFVRAAGRGGKGNIPLKAEISVEQTQPWDGGDGQLFEEDEFSLDELE